MKRIICIGNRLIERDSLGDRVYDILSRQELPPGVELVDGGLAGLNLLTLLDGCDHVIFVDTILGGGLEDVQVLHADEVEISSYGHAGGLGFLLGAYRALGADPVASIRVVGAGTVESAQRVAEAALVMAQGQEVRQ